AASAPGLREWTQGVRRLIGRVSAQRGPELLRRLVRGEEPRRSHAMDVSPIRWFTDRESYAAFVEPTRPARRAAEAEICRRDPVTSGFCTFCAAPATFV